MARRALTLLELLLALSLLLAVGALVLPMAMGSLRERGFEAGTENIRNQLLLARAHAGASGRPVEIRYEPSPSRIEARYFEPDIARDRGGETRAAPRPGASRRPGPEDAGDTDRGPEPGPTGTPSDPIVEGWAANLLPAGLSISAAPADPGSPGGSAPVGDAPPRPLRLAIFMPDGSALMSRPVWVGDEHGRQTKLTINPWTGLASQERSAASEIAAGPPEEEAQR